MLHNTEFIQDFMKRYSYPAEAVRLFTEILERLDADSEAAQVYDELYTRYIRHLARLSGDFLAELNALAVNMGYSEYTLQFVFLLSLTERLKQMYFLMGIPEKVYYETMDDLRCKLLECMEVKGVPGTFVVFWYDRFFRLELAAYGRFQYELRHYGKDLVINFHIPSSGVPISDDIRFASYKEAYAHFRHLFPSGKVRFMCESWLLFPDLQKFLSPDMNIIRFQNDFTFVERKVAEVFEDMWRIFGKYADLPYDQLPRDTKLRRAFADWLQAGNKAGYGIGLFEFDGENIVKE